MSGIRRSLPRALALAAAALVLAVGPAAAAPPAGEGSGGFALTQIGAFDQPIFADNAPGTNRNLYVAEQGGLIWTVTPAGTRRPTPFLDLRGRIMSGGEEGLLSFAFHPDYRRNRLLYVYFTNVQGDNEVVEFKRKDAKRFEAAPGSDRPVLTIPHPTFGNHNGGQIQFGPDELLYIAPGDGGGTPNQAQNPESLLGKVLRIDPRSKLKGDGKKGGAAAAQRPYRVPKKNPFVGEPGLNEIYSLGLRNPFRFSFDSLNGAIAIGDVGSGCREEISYRERGNARGANFGWPAFEGTRIGNSALASPGMLPPIHEYDNSGAGPECAPLGGFSGQAVIAGHVVRDERLTQQYGRLLYSDAYSSDVRSLIPTEGGALDDQSTGVVNPAGGAYSFAEGFGNRLYLLSGAGPVYRLDPS